MLPLWSCCPASTTHWPDKYPQTPPLFLALASASLIVRRSDSTSFWSSTAAPSLLFSSATSASSFITFSLSLTNARLASSWPLVASSREACALLRSFLNRASSWPEDSFEEAASLRAASASRRATSSWSVETTREEIAGKVSASSLVPYLRPRICQKLRVAGWPDGSGRSGGLAGCCCGGGG